VAELHTSSAIREEGGSAGSYNIRCRHHTDAEGLAGIKKDKAIKSSRGEPRGVDVEVAPFGPVNPFSRRSPKAETGAKGGGAYVEFDLPEGAVPAPWVGPRRNARIPTSGDSLSLEELNPTYEMIRWWQIWKWWGK
jgi:hypothetical protein